MPCLTRNISINEVWAEKNFVVQVLGFIVICSLSRGSDADVRNFSPKKQNFLKLLKSSVYLKIRIQFYEHKIIKNREPIPTPRCHKTETRKKPSLFITSKSSGPRRGILAFLARTFLVKERCPRKNSDCSPKDVYICLEGRGRNRTFYEGIKRPY